MHGRAANHRAVSQILLETVSDKSLGLIMLIYIAVNLPSTAGIAGWHSLACVMAEVRLLIRTVPSGLKIYKFRSG